MVRDHPRCSFLITISPHSASRTPEGSAKLHHVREIEEEISAEIAIVIKIAEHCPAVPMHIPRFSSHCMVYTMYSPLHGSRGVFIFNVPSPVCIENLNSRLYHYLLFHFLIQRYLICQTFHNRIFLYR